MNDISSEELLSMVYQMGKNEGKRIMMPFVVGAVGLCWLSLFGLRRNTKLEMRWGTPEKKDDEAVR